MFIESNKTSNATPIIANLISIAGEVRRFPYKDGGKEAFFNKVLNNSLEAVIVLNKHAGITHVSANAKDYVGYERKDLMGKSAFEFSKLIGFPLQRLFHANRNQHSSTLLELTHKNGEKVMLDVTMINLHSNDTIDGLLILITPGDYDEQGARFINAILNAKEQEKEYFASELHDNINQLITVSRLLVEKAMNVKDNAELLQLCLKSLLEVEREIRKLTSSLVCYELQDFGLLLSTKKFVETVMVAIPTSFDVNIEPQVEQLLTNDQKLHVYRIIQEALNNIIKHSKASVVSISLFSNDNKCLLKISDNGIGLNIDEIRRGVGISSVRNRVKILNGQCQLTSPKGEGTLLSVAFPITA